MLYVAYGSNMNLEQMAYRCPKSKVVSNGKLHGWKLVFNVHADVIKGKKKEAVPVVVWDIADEDWNMLDMYEGYPSYYVKEMVDVILENGKKEKAVVYVMADNRKGICPPASSYFNCIFKGYMDNGINTDYLFDALDYSYDNVTEYNQYKVKGDDLMRKNKDAYMNFVCPYCWNTLNKCTCDIFPPYHLVFIDKNIQEHIRILNEKGYRTTACCEAHKDICVSTYIAFANDYFKDIDEPEGFKFDKKRRIIAHIYSTKLTEEEMEEFKKEKLEILLEWCRNLPNRNMEN